MLKYQLPIKRRKTEKNELPWIYFQLCFMSILIKLNHTYIKVYVDIVINGNLLYIINQIDMYMDCFGFIVLEKDKER